MKLSKHDNHRNPAYLKWLRNQPCAASAGKAQCAHHIRTGTNGGSSLKPSDYFCIPLTNEHHTTGLFAIHVIGEETFFKEFKLKKKKLFVYYLQKYLVEKFEVHVHVKGIEDDILIDQMIKLIEDNGPKFDKTKKRNKKSKKTKATVPKVSITESEFYQKAKEAKKIKDKELRLKIKESETNVTKPRVKKKKTKSLVGTEFYEKAKEQKRLRDKELRQKMKTYQKSKKVSVTESEFYQKAKELKRIRDKEFRDKLKQQRKAKKNALV